MKCFVFSTLMVIVCFICKGQESKTESQIEAAIKALETKAFDLTRSLPINFVTDGSVDYTSFIQKGIDKYSVVKMPNFPVLVNRSGIKLNNGNKVIFQKRSLLKLEPNSSTGYSVILLSNVSDIDIYNLKIRGDRNEHIGTKGEWGMGMRISDSKNINIYNPIISHCWGDGIYFGDNSGNSVINDNIEIIGGFIDSNRRNGITITSGKNINIANTQISNSNGTMPKSGIDIEPNSQTNRLINITINNVVTRNNTGAGIIVSQSKLIGSNQIVSIYINNHKDFNGSMGYYVGRLGNGNSALRGEIVNSNASYVNSKTNGILIENYAAENTPRIILNHPTIINSNVSGQTSPRWGSGIVFLRDSKAKENNKLGNITIKNAQIIDNRSIPKMKAGFHFIDDKKNVFSNTVIEGEVEKKGISNDRFYNIAVKGVRIKNQ